MLVLAGPGTGKTQLLSVRAANILFKTKVNPENILILTFTNAAARAMRERLSKIVGNDGYSMEVETFHSFANSIVLEEDDAIEHVKEKIEISEVEKVRAIEYILDNEKGVEPLRPFGAPYIHRKEIEAKISNLKNEGVSPVEFKAFLKEQNSTDIGLESKHISRLKALSIIYEKYEKLKNEECTILFDERGRIDYDDMVLIAIEAIKGNKTLAENLTKQYKYIMVDEYQDTNGAQLELLFSIIDKNSPNICCVGDDDQAIFRFQGATLSNFRMLKEKFPSLKTIALKNNYRSDNDIINFSSRIISQVPDEERIAIKKLVSCRQYSGSDIKCLEFTKEEEELAFIVEKIKEQVEIIKKDKTLSDEERLNPYNNIAVLLRKRSQILKVIDAFLKEGIPYATDGEEDIRSEKRVKQMLDVLELINIFSEDLERKSHYLYKILVSDYIGADNSDILKVINFVNKQKNIARRDKGHNYREFNLFEKFQEYFSIFSKNEKGEDAFPSCEESKELKITKELGLTKPHALHANAWAIKRMLTNSSSSPVHDILMRYIGDTRIYKFILKRYENDKVIRVRDLRALVSFVNMVKQADLSHPAVGLDEFVKELKLKEIHGMPIRGELATLSQNGIRIYTAHKAKGLEFYSVFVPFCLGGRSWPPRGKSDVIPLPPKIYKSEERAREKSRSKLLSYLDELRLFYVAATRAKSRLFFTSAPAEKVITSPFLTEAGMVSEMASVEDEENFLAKYLETEKEEQDSFEGTADILKDIIVGLTLNPTSLNNYIKCKRKFLYDNVLRLPARKNQHLTFGNCAHKALEGVYADFMEQEKFPNFNAFKNYFKDELKFQGVSDSIKSWCSDRLEALDGWYKTESDNPVMPLDLENKLEIVLGNDLFFRGTFDKIEEESDGNIRVVDYKTGKPDKHVKAIINCRELSSTDCDDYYRQLIAYKMLYERANQKDVPGKKVNKGVLEFLDPVGVSVKKYDLEKGEYKKITVELTEKMVDELEKLIIKCWKDIKNLKFDKLDCRDDKERCCRCEYDTICWK